MSSVKLVYFSWIRERLDLSDEIVELPASVETIGDLLTWLKTRGEEFEAAFEYDKVIRIALDHEHVDDRATAIAEAKEIALFPPMTGG